MYFLPQSIAIIISRVELIIADDECLVLSARMGLRKTVYVLSNQFSWIMAVWLLHLHPIKSNSLLFLYRSLLYYYYYYGAGNHTLRRSDPSLCARLLNYNRNEVD